MRPRRWRPAAPSFHPLAAGWPTGLTGTAQGVAVPRVVTLDPWRDTPARLPAIAAQWQLPRDAFVASGDTGAVTATLERWNVARQRDLRNGEIAHATLVYLIDREGQVAYAVSGSVGAAALVDLARRL